MIMLMHYVSSTHTLGYTVVLLPIILFKSAFSPAPVSHLQRFLQSCPATLAANGSHALYNLGYTGKIRYKVNEKGSIWVKYSVEKCGNLLQKEYLPSISTQKSCICFGLIISEAKPQKTYHMQFNRDGSFYLCQYALDIKDTILDKITICYVNGSQIPRVKLLCVFCFIYPLLAPFSLLF